MDREPACASLRLGSMPHFAHRWDAVRFQDQCVAIAAHKIRADACTHKKATKKKKSKNNNNNKTKQKQIGTAKPMCSAFMLITRLAPDNKLGMRSRCVQPLC